MDFCQRYGNIGRRWSVSCSVPERLLLDILLMGQELDDSNTWRDDAHQERLWAKRYIGFCQLRDILGLGLAGMGR